MRYGIDHSLSELLLVLLCDQEPIKDRNAGDILLQQEPNHVQRDVALQLLKLLPGPYATQLSDLVMVRPES